jgi:hypothetical protein
MYILRNNFDFWWTIVNIVMSICGTAISPLCFCFHLFRIAQLPDLTIVIRSITVSASVCKCTYWLQYCVRLSC